MVGMRDDRDNIIIDLTFKFSLAIIEYCELWIID